MKYQTKKNVSVCHCNIPLLQFWPLKSPKKESFQKLKAGWQPWEVTLQSVVNPTESVPDVTILNPIVSQSKTGGFKLMSVNLQLGT